jgi:hypothetical protein
MKGKDERVALCCTEAGFLIYSGSEKVKVIVSPTGRGLNTYVSLSMIKKERKHVPAGRMLVGSNPRPG